MRPSSGSPSSPGGRERRRADRVLERRAELVQVADGLDHRQHAAREHAVRAAHGAFVHLQVELAERRRRRRRAAPRRSRRRRARCGPRAAVQTVRRRLGREVDAVEDDRDETSSRASAAPTMPGSRCRSGRIALKRWVTLRAPRVERGVRLRGGRVGVAERDDDAALEQHGRSARRRPASSGASVISRTGPASSSRSSSAQVGVAARRRLVRAEPVRREERALRGACRGSAAGGVVDRHLAHRGEHLLLRARDQRREVRGHAGLEQRVAGAAVAGGVGVEEVDAAEAVHLQVDEARDGEARGRACRRGRSAATRPSTTSTSPGTSTPSTSAASTPDRSCIAPV